MSSGITKSPFIQIEDCRIIKQTHSNWQFNQPRITSPNYLPNEILVLTDGVSASANGGRGGGLRPRVTLNARCAVIQRDSIFSTASTKGPIVFRVFRVSEALSAKSEASWQMLPAKPCHDGFKCEI